ncbi:hypothetical protein L226DRAFT_591598 [Lentinus tigrinus ALCF2SS1-7]|uniref:AB hydrolase-1 domain-containing protein n=1 Tax=Lentinus tigrinus ALCF2SS1-6 TaxID=1328759 RepID=A0A5C2RWK0_9APHY|nr:hypothetical protein L227DRAFT_595625 [Lentinus tigrinus ALCF2SS1-6]RPD71301.1 hypothetical protein L226DRAFT_591598 [Lentinus tigrinus ALCF2SS1-7]
MAQTETTLLRTFLDSGAPPGSTDYTTLVIIHGWGFHGGNFKKLIPLAPKFNTRVVLVNRRDYPGSVPFTAEQRAEINRLASAPAGTPGAAEALDVLMKERARELYDYLVELVRRGGVVPAQGKKGGLVLAGWSLGATWLSALLTHVASFPVEDVNLKGYVRRIVYYDSSYICHGYNRPKELYHPLHDPELEPSKVMEQFGIWVSAYFAHGDVGDSGLAALASHHYLDSPSPTITRMTAEEIAESTYSAPGEEGGSELGIAMASIAHGTYASLRKGAFHLQDLVPGADDWRDVEIRYLWCDASIWEMPLAYVTLKTELEEAKKAGKATRNVAWVRFRGANHFAHWDLPEKTLRGFLGEDAELQ